MPLDKDPKTDDSAAYDTALTEIYGAKEELNALDAAAQQTKLKTTIGHLGTANELANQLAGQDQAALGTSSANRQALYAQGIDSAEAQGEHRRLYSMAGDSALRNARDNQLAGYDLELDNLGGRSGLLGARHEKAQADLADDSANQQQSAYNSALGSMYSGGSSAGFAKSADQSLAETAGRAQDSIDRESSLVDTAFAQAGSDLSTQIQKTELGRSSTVEAAEHRLGMSSMQRQMEMDKVRQQVDRLRTQSGADRDDNEYRTARAELSLQLQNEVSDNNIAIQEQALGLAQASEPLEAKALANEGAALLARNSANTFESILVGGSN